MRLAIPKAFGLLAALALSSADARCGMTKITTTGSAATPIYASASGLPALYFRANMDVNTDGASRSYHPQDPRGQSLALNNIANGITEIYDAQGARITCRPRSGACFKRFIETFEAARDAQWNPVGHPRVETRDIIPWAFDAALGRSAPCTIKAGPYRGYLVSQTSRAADPARPVCDQARYLDSMTLNAIVLPRGAAWRSQGIVTDEFDLVAARDRASGEIRYAVVGDRGPADSLGEGTVALTASLRKRTLTGQETYSQVKALALANVDYVLFPTYDVKRREPGAVTAEKIERWGKAAFEAWGGVARLDRCRAELQP